MQETEEKATVTKPNGKKWGIFGAIAVIAIALLIGIGNSYSPSGRLRKQLDLGQKYLEEMKYEEAVVAFNNAIEIDPMSVDAYLGLVEVYIRTGDFETALSYAQKGYDLTGDERLKEKIDMIESGNITASNGWVMKRSRYYSGKLICYMTYSYDLQGRKKTAALYNGANQLVGREDYEYNEQGREIVDWGEEYNADGSYVALCKTEREYNAEGREIRHKDYDGSGNLSSYTEYDSEGRMIFNKYYDDSGNLESSSEFKYDSEGRLYKQLDYGGTGRLEQYFENEYDAEGRQIGCKIYGGSGKLQGYNEMDNDTEGRKIAERQYDASGNLVYYTEWEYNAEGQRRAVRSYDASGNLLDETRFE